MKKLTFEQLKKDNRYCISHKVWYTDYPFKITFKKWDMFDGNFTNMFHKYSYVKIRLKHSDHDFKSRHDYNFAVYLKTLEAVQEVVSYFNKDIERIDGPISEKHQDVMVDDLDVTVRKKFFYNKYKYKVSMKKYRWEGDMDIFTDVSEFVRETFDPETYYLNTILKSYSRLKELEKTLTSQYNSWRVNHWIPYTATGSVYLTEYDDVCTMHLLYKQHITSTSKVVLIEDLE